MKFIIFENGGNRYRVCGIKVCSNDVSLINEIVSIGKYGCMKKYSELSFEEKNKIIGQLFGEKLQNNMKDSFNNISIKWSGSNLLFDVYVPVSLSGYIKQCKTFSESKYRDLRYNVRVFRLCFSDFFYYSKDKLEFTATYIPIRSSMEEVKEFVTSKSRITKFKANLYDFTLEKEKFEKVISLMDLPVFLDFIKDKMELLINPDNKEVLLTSFLNVLYRNGISKIKSEHIPFIRTIYSNSKKFFPTFNNLSIDEQVNLLTEGYYITYNMKHPYELIDQEGLSFSKYFLLLLGERGYLDIFNYKGKTYYYVDCIHRKGMRHFISIVYKFKLKNGVEMKKTFLASDLWRVLYKTDIDFLFDV